MKRGFSEKQWLLVCTICACSAFLVGCVSFPSMEELVISSPNNNSHSILNLQNISHLNASMLRQTDLIMRNGLLDTSTEEYGYFSVDLDWSLDSDLTTAICIISYPTLFIGLFPALLFGVPMQEGYGNIYATLKIYDSNHDLIKSYNESRWVTKYAGLYYSGDMTKKVSKEYTKLFTTIFESVQMQSSEINRALRAAGPVTAEKERLYKEKLAAAQKGAAEREANRPVVNNYSYDYSAPSSPSQSSVPTSRPAEPSGWNLSVLYGEKNIGGTWNSSVGRGNFMVLNGNGLSGSITLMANGKQSFGTVTISGDTLNIYITSGQFAGEQFRYRIVSNRLIQGDGENFSK